MKRKHIHLCLDIILGIGIITLMNKQLFGLLYHEIAGVTVVLVMIAHIAINIKSIRGMARNFQKIPLSARLCLITDILLTAALAADGVSGVMISKKLFAGLSEGGFAFKTIHYFSAALMIILLGIHVGLHIGRRKMAVKTAVVLMSAAIVCGAFGVAQSSMGRWLSMPFASAGEQQGGPEGMNAIGGQSMTGSDENETNTQDPEGSSAENNLPAVEETEFAADLPETEETASGAQTEGFGGGRPNGKDHTPAPFYQRVWSILQYWGMTFSIAMTVYFVMRRGKGKPATRINNETVR